MRQMDQDDTSLSEQIKQIKENFAQDWAKDRRNWRKLFHRYGRPQVEEWIKDDAIILRADEIAAQDKIRAQQYENLKPKCFDILNNAVEGKDVTDAQLKVAFWVLSGERSFADSYAKVRGEQAAVTTDKKPATVINLVKSDRKSNKS